MPSGPMAWCMFALCYVALVWVAAEWRRERREARPRGFEVLPPRAGQPCGDKGPGGGQGAGVDDSSMARGCVGKGQ